MVHYPRLRTVGGVALSLAAGLSPGAPAEAARFNPNAPSLSVIGRTSFNACVDRDTVIVDLVGTDADLADVVTLGVAPAGAVDTTFGSTPGNPAAGLFTFTPTAAGSGTGIFFFLFKADDDGVPPRGVTDAIVIFVSACNSAPIADAGGPYDVACGAGSPVILTLDGSGSTDPDGDPLAYLWTTDCPGASIANLTAVVTDLTFDVALPPCPQACKVELRASDPVGAADLDEASVTVDDPDAPIVIARLEALAPAPPGSACSATSSGLFRVVCTADDACDPDPTLAARLAVASYSAPSRGSCARDEQTIDVACDGLVELRVLAPACPQRPRSPATAFSVRSDGILVVSGEELALAVTATDACGNTVVATVDPTADGSSCPPLARPPDPKCKLPLCGRGTIPVRRLATVGWRSQGGNVLQPAVHADDAVSVPPSPLPGAPVDAGND